VQGTGGDIGADLIGRRELSALYVRGSERTIAQAERGHVRTEVPLHVLRGGGNALIVGPDVSADRDTLVEAITTSVRMNSAGGPFGLPLLAVHAEQAEELLQALLLRLSVMVAAPLPTEPLRRRAVQRIDSLLKVGATAVLGGPGFPDDISHRMSWRLPPAVLLLGGPESAAARLDQATVPLGPVLSVVTWNDWQQLRTLFTAPRARDGIVSLWGVDEGLAAGLPHGRVVAGPDSPTRALATTLAPTWTGGAR
jgi:acyl-CoA reductase-like NAD-dependent aldehyde dehydrogenase